MVKVEPVQEENKQPMSENVPEKVQQEEEMAEIEPMQEETKQPMSEHVPEKVHQEPIEREDTRLVTAAQDLAH